ncbi:sensor domain-containing protein [Pseudomonas syringae]|uniref:sensor domain-containing protein n=1 Tax=Pseudomonas syringae TaxID=317 RepID=UPI00294ABB8C|nr:bifunctional diguanylate cyclase/phosphodiesterase [Pseudomonas syringae]WOK31762.1 bifunctional diguanylate cyclase/phosphodiesterase [Pseudomonas syringae pv. actinidiae]
MIDISDREAWRLSEGRFASVFAQCPDAMIIASLIDGHIMDANQAFVEHTGLSIEEVIGKTPTELDLWAVPGIGPKVLKQLQTGNIHNLEIPFRRKNGQTFSGLMSAQPFEQGSTPAVLVIVRDITRLKLAQQQLQLSEEKFAKAFHAAPDGLAITHQQDGMLLEVNEGFCRITGYSELHCLEHYTFDLGIWADLSERSKLIEQLEQHGVVHGFRARLCNVNGSIRVCELSSHRLKEALRDIDTVARLGGDEFIVLLPGLLQPSDAKAIANKLLACFSTPFEAGEHELYISPSIGSCVFPTDGTDVATLVKNADAAMYRSKAQGRNRVESYTRDLTEQASERIALEQERRRALDRNQLSLAYQPKISILTHTLVGAEALIRWSHPTFGEVPPEHFIPLAEENGMILQIGEWVLEQACRQMGAWRKTCTPFGPMSVNLAGAQLRQPNLVERIEQLLTDNGLVPDCLQLEITENFIMSQTQDALAVLHKLKQLGVQLAIDDFGTGYSSLSYLKRLPLDILKIDQSFIRGLPEDTHDAAIVRAIIALGRSMQLTVIAEGVETREQQQFLSEEGCEQIQGYIISLPLQPDEFSERFLLTNLSDVSDSTAAKPPL